MSDQTYYNKPSNQSDQNNNTIMWVVLAVVVAAIFLFAIFSTSGNEPLNTNTPNPVETQIPQEPQATQIPQEPQATQIPQEPQSTQIPQPTTIPTSTVQ